MSGRSLEAKNIQKQENLLCRVKTKIKGIVRKSPDLMKNMFRTSTNYQTIKVRQHKSYP
jgi:hypothetical protein